jgi:hypothetical protein
MEETRRAAATLEGEGTPYERPALNVQQGIYRGLGVYCRPYCKRRGIEGKDGDEICIGISNFLIPKGSVGSKALIEGSPPLVT